MMKALHISDFEAHMKRMHNKNAHAAKKKPLLSHAPFKVANLLTIPHNTTPHHTTT